MATPDVHSSRCCMMLEINKYAGRQPFCTFWGLSGAYFDGLIHQMIGKLRNACRSSFCSRGCLGCCAEPQLIVAVDKPSKGLKIQGRAVKKAGVVEEFWSSSTYEMENSAIQSQRSISSISTQNPDPNNSASTSNPSEYVNHGLLLWNQVRQQWVGEKKTEKQTKVQEPRLSMNATYERLLGTSKPFPEPIPLSEMVEFLIEVWEQEGLYD